MNAPQRVRRDDAPADKDATLRRLTSFNTQLQDEAQIVKDAACWRRLVEESPEFAARITRIWQGQ
jgi:hypothetical protein